MKAKKVRREVRRDHGGFVLIYDADTGAFLRREQYSKAREQ